MTQLLHLIELQHLLLAGRSERETKWKLGEDISLRKLQRESITLFPVDLQAPNSTVQKPAHFPFIYARKNNLHETVFKNIYGKSQSRFWKENHHKTSSYVITPKFLGILDNDKKDAPCIYIMKMYFHSKDAFNSSIFYQHPHKVLAKTTATHKPTRQWQTEALSTHPFVCRQTSERTAAAQGFCPKYSLE